MEYEKLLQGITKHLEENYERKSTEGKENDIKSGKQIAKEFTNVLKNICDLYPEMTRPFLSGNITDDQGMRSLSDLPGGANDPCMEDRGSIDVTKTTTPTIAKPIGEGSSHRSGKGESKSRIIQGDSKILSPSSTIPGDNRMPELKVVVLQMDNEKPPIFFNPSNRLVINSTRPASYILTDAIPKDPEVLKARYHVVLSVKMEHPLRYGTAESSTTSTY
jgi:hypothetical protein